VYTLPSAIDWLTTHSGLASWGTLLVALSMFSVALKTYLKKYPFKKTKISGGQKWEIVWSHKGDSSKNHMLLDVTTGLGGQSRAFGSKKNRNCWPIALVPSV
jgi:hypothetical protein